MATLTAPATSAPGRHAAGRPEAPAHAGIVVRDLVKAYSGGRGRAVDDLSFDVVPGEVLGLLGPNGAGKSTTVGVVTTRIRPTSGTVLVGGYDVSRDPAHARARLAVVPQRPTLDRSLSVQSNLVFSARYRAVPKRVARERAEALLERLGLADRAGERVDRLSGGQAQRVMVARALMTAPSVLLLDEPTTGLDPAARRFIWDLVADLRADGIAVLVTTHDMHEATELCGRVAVVDHGTCLALDTPERLVGRLPRAGSLDLTVAGIADPTDLIDTLASMRDVLAADPLPAPTSGAPAPVGAGTAVTEPPAARIRVRATTDPATLVAPAARAVEAHHGRLVDVHLGRPDLEDVFFDLTGRELR